MDDSSKRVIAAFSDKEYRDAAASEFSISTLALQIRALRDDRELTQAKLADMADMKQEMISRYENPNYGRYTLETLKRLASAFDVALLVQFVPFSALIKRIVSPDPAELVVPPFAEDMARIASSSNTPTVRNVLQFPTLDAKGPLRATYQQNVASTTARAIDG